MSHLVIGIDGATQPGKVGLARAERRGSGAEVTDCLLGANDALPIAVVLGWLEGAESGLLYLDAPLGWPVALGRAWIGTRRGTRWRSRPSSCFTGPPTGTCGSPCRWPELPRVSPHPHLHAPWRLGTPGSERRFGESSARRFGDGAGTARGQGHRTFLPSTRRTIRVARPKALNF